MKVIILLILTSFSAFAQASLPVIKSNSNVVTIKDGTELRKDSWRLAPEAKPDIYEARLIKGAPHKVEFITDVESISFMVEEGKKYDFVIQRGTDMCYTQIVGTRFVPEAEFDEKYRSRHNGKISADIPEVYELVNIAIAMTPTGLADKNLIYQNSDYYKDVRAWFDKYQPHPLLAALDAELKKPGNLYFNLKMNGYAFEYDKAGKIVKSKVFDRTGWGNSNSLETFLPQLQSFSDETRFRDFYKKNRKTYLGQIAFFRKTADIAEMKRWLDKNFPASSNYNYYNIVFSPLVAYNQSSNWFESNGFKELQPHVNFPYPEDLSRSTKEVISEKAQNIIRGNIVFTEINHGYINPEAEKYGSRILNAVSNRDRWVFDKYGPGYYPNIGTFNEYMNWGLVSLRIVDYIPPAEQDKLIATIDTMMVTRRGFLQFDKFDKFLVDLYKNRKSGQTVADLYPRIIEWFERENVN